MYHTLHDKVTMTEINPSLVFNKTLENGIHNRRK